MIVKVPPRQPQSHRWRVTFRDGSIEDVTAHSCDTGEHLTFSLAMLTKGDPYPDHVTMRVFPPGSWTGVKLLGSYVPEEG